MERNTILKLKYYDVNEINLDDLLKEYQRGFRFIKKDKKRYYDTISSIRKKYYILCQKCNKYKGMNVHHIDRNRNNESLNNLIILCKACHRIEHNPLAKNFNWNGGGSRTHYNLNKR